MSGDAHVRFCESVGVRLPGATHPKIIGRSMTLDGKKYTVTGVMPRSFKFAVFWVRGAELWAPLALGSRAANRGGNSLRIFARLKRTLEQARAEMATLTAHLETEYPGTNRNVTVLPLKEKMVGDIRPALLVLLGAVGFVLLIACPNVAHMQLARAAVFPGNGRAANAGIHGGKARREFAQHGIYQRAQLPQGVVGRHALLRGTITVTEVSHWFDQ